MKKEGPFVFGLRGERLEGRVTDIYGVYGRVMIGTEALQDYDVGGEISVGTNYDIQDVGCEMIAMGMDGIQRVLLLRRWVSRHGKIYILAIFVCRPAI